MSTKKSPAASAARGPKTDETDVKNALLTSGRELYSQSGFNAVPLREVAQRAGVNQAMVRYYFKDKHGFMSALLDDGFDHLIDAGNGAHSLQDLVERLIVALNGMPWLPVLIAKSVYFNAELREHFVNRHAPRLVDALGRALPTKKGINPEYAVLSILSMLIFPQIARPVVGGVFSVQFDDAFAQSFAAHIARLFA